MTTEDLPDYVRSVLPELQADLVRMQRKGHDPADLIGIVSDGSHDMPRMADVFPRSVVDLTPIIEESPLSAPALIDAKGVLLVVVYHEGKMETLTWRIRSLPPEAQA